MNEENNRKIMTPEQKSECHKIIHSMAVIAAGGNAIPLPGLGVLADIGTMTAMSVKLGYVFDQAISNATAEALAKSALKKTIEKSAGKVAAKELSKFVPGLGSVVSPVISAGLIEAAGWEMAYRLDRKSRKK